MILWYPKYGVLFVCFFSTFLQHWLITISYLFCVCHFTGKKFENTEMFGQYPLQVNGFKDLHECLEAAMIEGEIESLHSAENSARSGQEVSAKAECQQLFPWKCAGHFEKLYKPKWIVFCFHSQMFIQVNQRLFVLHRNCFNSLVVCHTYFLEAQHQVRD